MDPTPDSSSSIGVVRDLLDRARTANDQDQPHQAVELVTTALDALAGIAASGVDTLTAELLRTAAYATGRLGHTDRSMDLLDRALAADPGQTAAIAAARAATLFAAGRPEAALLAFDRAMPLLAARPDLSYVSALINRGVLHMAAGRLTAAREDTGTAAAVARTVGLSSQRAFAEHNLGYIRYLQGDLCGALDLMASAEAGLPEAALTMSALDRSKVLSAAGLVSDADEYGEQAVRGFEGADAVHDLASACLALSEIKELAGDHRAALDLARRSGRISREQQHPANVLLADLAEALLARVAEQQDAVPNNSVPNNSVPNDAVPVAPPGEEGTPTGDGARTADLPEADLTPVRTVEQLLDLAERLESAGLPDHAVAARLGAADTAIDGGQPDLAESILDTVPAVEPFAGQGLILALQQHLVAGRADLARDRPEAGLDRLRTGLDDLARVQAGFGSQDLQTAAAVHGRRLAALGLRTVVADGDPGRILEWLDRSRAVSTRLPVVSPPADEVLAADLGSLRVAADTALQARIAGSADPTSEAIVDRLRRKVRARAWITIGSGEVAAPVDVATAAAALEADPGAQLLAVFVGGDRVHTVTVDGEGGHHREAGSAPALLAAVRRVAADLDVLAMARVPTAIRQVARRSLDDQLALVAAMVLPPQLAAGTGTLVVAAVGEIATLPWNLLPPLVGRPVRVNASITAGLLGPRSAPVSANTRTFLVHGPGVPRGAEELAQVGARYRDVRLLEGAAATGEALVRALGEADLVHIAAHGVHEPDNPQFSGLLLSGGPLFAYDLAPVRPLPQQVVLSSCDVGRSTDRPGGEPLGLTAALLRFGVPTVVAGTARIADDIAATVMADYHRHLTGGASPAAALARSVAAAPEPAALVCFGA